MNAPFRRLSRRRRARALLVALVDRIELGPPTVVTGVALPAKADGWCPGCGSYYRRDTPIVMARLGNGESPVVTWIHATCPSWWELIDDVTEARDDIIVTQVTSEGRRVASCGHSVDGRPAYLVRRPVSRTQLDHSYWICEECVTR